MTLAHQNSLVFVGGEFPVEMFDERAVFGGNLDRGAQVRMGPMGQFSYSAGTYRFEIAPPRIDLKHHGAEIIPDALVDAAAIVAAKIEPARGAVSVSGFGMNCDTVFDRESIGTSGLEFCSRLISERLPQLVGATSGEATTRIRFDERGVRYEVRIEPHANSRGENLLVAVNGHQTVRSEERLDSKFAPGLLQAFRVYIQGLHQRITDTARSA